MPSLDNYGSAIAATTAAIEQLIDGVTSQVTTRSPDAARVGVAGGSVNVFLYRDELAGYRDGRDPRGVSHIVAELRYLISTHAADDADTDLLSQRAYGSARAAIERTPVITVPVESDSPIQIRLTTTALTIEDLTSLWIASTAPLRLSFGVTASFTLSADDPPFVAGSLRDVVARASPGLLVVFAGLDTSAKSAAAESVAKELAQPIMHVALGEIVSKYIGETEQSLAKLFARAEDNDVVLFFDEADALFGRRSEEPNGHDRYAEIEVGHVLDLLARAPGVVIFGLVAAGEELARRASIEVRFPPDED